MRLSAPPAEADAGGAGNANASQKRFHGVQVSVSFAGSALAGHSVFRAAPGGSTEVIHEIP